MMKRVILGWVRVTGPPAAICCLNKGITEPREPSTLPNRLEAKIVRPLRERALAAVISRSAMSFEVPMTLVGLTALSDEVNSTRSTPALERRLDDVLRADDVGLDRRARRPLAQRDVLEAGGVDDDVDAFHQRREAVGIADIGQRERDVVVVGEVVLQEEQGALVVVDADDAAQLAAGELAQDLAARPCPRRR